MSEASGEIGPWLTVTQTTPGRVIVAMNQMEAKIETDADRALLLPLINKARDAGWVQLESDANWLRNKGVQPTRPEAKKADPPADRCVGALHNGLAKSVDALAPAGEDDENDEDAIEEASIRDGAQEILEQYFVGGAAAITALRYEDQFVQMKRLVQALKQEKFRAVIEKLGLGLYLRRLERLLPKYEAALGNVGTRAITFEGVTANRTATHTALTEVIGALLAPRSIESRATLLNPVALQQRLTAEARTARRPLRDLNPTTGEESDAPVLELPEATSTASPPA